MTAPADIICFAKDWNEPATSVNHVMAELAQRHRVLWINSIGMRRAKLSSTGDWNKIFRKLRDLFRGIQRPQENIRVVTPLVIPLPDRPWAQRCNRALVRWVVRRVAREWGLRRPQLWIFQPNAMDYIGSFDESLVVYYCVDDFAGFTYLNADFIRDKDAELTRRADIVFVTARKLLSDKFTANKRVYLIPHGVNHARFAAAHPVPADIAGLPRPVIGFYGNLYDWVDQQLIADIAAARPSWSFVLIGKIMSDIATLQRFPNIHLLGSRPFADLPAYCKGFDAGLIPYRTADPRMQSVNPLKLREYLAAGLAVVSVDLPEIRGVSEGIRLAHTATEFIEQIEAALAGDSIIARQQRSLAMRTETWAARVEIIERLLSDMPEASRV